MISSVFVGICALTFCILSIVFLVLWLKPGGGTDTIPPGGTGGGGGTNTGTGTQTTGPPVSDGTWQCVQSSADGCSWLKVKKTGSDVVCAGPNNTSCFWNTSKAACESAGSTDGLKCTQTSSGWCKDALTVLNGGTTACFSTDAGGGGNVSSDGYIHVGEDAAGIVRVDFDTWQIYADGVHLAFISRDSGKGYAFNGANKTTAVSENWIATGNKSNVPSFIALKNWSLACGKDRFVIKRRSDKTYWQLRNWTESIQGPDNSDMTESKVNGLVLGKYWKIDGEDTNMIKFVHNPSRNVYLPMATGWTTA